MLTAMLLAAAFHADVAGQGRPVVFIPGLASSGDVWKPAAARLGPGFQTHVLTLAGFAGQPPVDEPLLPAARRELVAYLKKLDRPILVGHSLGATLALEVAAETDVAGVVAVDGVPFLPALYDPRATEESGRAMAARIPPPSPESYALSAATMATAPADQKRIAAWGAASSPRAVAEAIADVMSHDRRPLMTKVRAPILLVATGDPSRYEEQVKLAPRHRVISAPQGARHFVMLDAPAFLDETLAAFVKELR